MVRQLDLKKINLNVRCWDLIDKQQYVEHQLDTADNYTCAHVADHLDGSATNVATTFSARNS